MITQWPARVRLVQINLDFSITWTSCPKGRVKTLLWPMQVCNKTFRFAFISYISKFSKNLTHMLVPLVLNRICQLFISGVKMGTIDRSCKEETRSWGEGIQLPDFAVIGNKNHLRSIRYPARKSNPRPGTRRGWQGEENGTKMDQTKHIMKGRNKSCKSLQKTSPKMPFHNFQLPSLFASEFHAKNLCFLLLSPRRLLILFPFSYNVIHFTLRWMLRVARGILCWTFHFLTLWELCPSPVAFHCLNPLSLSNQDDQVFLWISVSSSPTCNIFSKENLVLPRNNFSEYIANIDKWVLSPRVGCSRMSTSVT